MFGRGVVMFSHGSELKELLLPVRECHVLELSAADFFFSSRRRHTRCLSDWSSDVCSSDLAEPAVANAQFDSDEPTKVIRLVVDQNKARVLGFSSQDLAVFLNSSVSGLSVTYVRERDKQIEIGKASCRERVEMEGMAVGVKE